METTDSRKPIPTTITIPPRRALKDMEVTDNSTSRVVVQAVSRETLTRAHLSLAIERYDELRCRKFLGSSRGAADFEAAAIAASNARRIEDLERAIKEIEAALGFA
jgi:hypothetical protein